MMHGHFLSRLLTNRANFPLVNILKCGASTSAVESIRNIGISAHIDSGKTTVTERILYYAGIIDQVHEVRGKDQVGATMDSMDLERERGITIQSAATYIDWKGNNINIIDTPGHVDFTVEVERALRVLDGAVLVLCAKSGVQSQTFTVNRQMARYNVPFLTFINKLDRAGASHQRALDGLRNRLRHNAAFMQLPIGLEGDLKGVVDLLTERAMYFSEPDGLTVDIRDIPEDMKVLAHDKRQELLECASNADEELGEMFLEDIHPNLEQLKAGIKRGVTKRAFVPVLMGSALKNKGVQPLLDAIIDYMPNPIQVQNYAKVTDKEGVETPFKLVGNRTKDLPFVGLAFKLEAGRYGQLTYIRVYQGRLAKGDSIYNTREGRKVRVQRLVRMHASAMQDIDEAFAGDICATFGIDCASGDTFCDQPRSRISLESMHIPEPVISMSIQPKSKKDAENFIKALTRFTKEDPTFKREYNDELKENVVSGMGELHLEIYAQRMKSEYNCEVELGKPKVSFRETLTQPCKYDHFHKKQTGGQGQYGRVSGIVEVLSPEDNIKVKFTDRLVGESIPKRLVPALRKGFNEMIEHGPLMGYKICGINFIMLDGAHHDVDSTEIAMINTAKGAMNDVFFDGQWGLLEPVMKVEVSVPTEFQPAVMTGLGKRNAIIAGSTVVDDFVVITCEVPLNSMFNYASTLRAATEGKGEFSMEYCRYAPVPQSDVDSIVSQIRIEKGLDPPPEEKQKRRARR